MENELKIKDDEPNFKKEYTFKELQTDLLMFKETYDFIRINEIGKSILRKPIYELVIGEGKKKIHINASFHANEWITTAIIMKFVNDYLFAFTHNEQLNGEDIRQFYKKIELSIVPMVNPDGVDLVIEGPPRKFHTKLIDLNGGSADFSAWKANIRGVDLNNQFPASWEIEKMRKIPKVPASRDYPGDAPLTEPEADALAKLACKKHFDLMIALHTQGSEFYWGYEDLEPEESAELAQIFQDVSGYEAVKYIDSHAGYRDWFIEKFRKPGFTFELGLGENPLPLTQFDKIYKAMLNVFLTCLKYESQ